jgi:sterol desaturase/sphingolipid hydroxylase (fatty acid hydroxylase superfamily)
VREVVAYIVDWLLNSSYFYATWITFFSAALVSFSIQIFKRCGDLSLRGFVRHCFPFEVWSSKSARMDIMLWVLSKVLDRLLRELPSIASAVAVAALLNSYLKQFIPHFVTIQPTGWIVASCIAGLFVFKEFVDYSLHYLQHRVPILWELHKVHHSALHLIPLTAKRGHPLEILIGGAVAGIASGLALGICGFIFGLNLPELILSAAVLNKIMTIGSLDTLRHSQFALSFGWLDKVFISPHMHHIHHSSHPHHWDKNFGTNLSIFDWMFGTAYKPSKNEDIAYGIGNEEEEEAHFTLTGALVGPLPKMWRLITRRPTTVPSGIVVETGPQTQPASAAGQ